MNPRTESPGPAGGAHAWSVLITEQGRGGTVTYREPGGDIPMTWEFGGNDVVAMIRFEEEAVWIAWYPWAASRRKEILQRVADEAIRQKAPSCLAEIDERSGWINLRQAAPPPLSPPVGAPVPLSTNNPHWAFRERKAKIMTIIAVVVLLLAAVAVGAKSLLSVRSASGAPLGESVRTPEHVATLIQTLESYMPTLHRDPKNDRYRLALLLTPQDGSSPGKMVPIVEQRPVNEFMLVRILGCDGTTVWFNFGGIRGVNLKTRKLVGAAELRRANPLLDETWDDSRRFEFNQRLRFTSADRQQIYEIAPDTLQATPTTRKPVEFPTGPKVADFLTTGVRPTPTEWLGVHSAKSAAGYYAVGTRLWAVNRAEDAKEQRSFYRSQLGPEVEPGKRDVLTQDRVSTDEYLNAAFVRSGPEPADPLRFTGPESFLMGYTSKPGLQGTLILARVDGAGKLLWKTDTNIDRFQLRQILPHPRYPAFIGVRPNGPNEVVGPMMVVVDVETGKASTVSLWQ